MLYCPLICRKSKLIIKKQIIWLKNKIQINVPEFNVATTPKYL